MGIDAIAQSGSALVEQDEPRERRQPAQKMAVAGILPVDFEIGDEPRHEDEIERTLAHHLVGDPGFPARRISGLGRFHGTASRVRTSDRLVLVTWRGSGSCPEFYQLVDNLSISR